MKTGRNIRCFNNEDSLEKLIETVVSQSGHTNEF